MKRNLKNIKKISFIILTFFILLLVFVSTAFGFYYSFTNSGDIDSRYKDQLQIETKVNFLDKTKDVNVAADSIVESFEFLGIQNYQISTLGDDEIILSFPIDSYQDPDNEKTNIELMKNSTNNSNYLSEIENTLLPILFNGTLDFRTVKGNKIIDMEEENGMYDFYFDQSTIESDNEIEDSSTQTENYNIEPSYITIDESDKPWNFFGDAEIKYENGSPYINIELKEEGTNDDEYLNVFKDFDNWIDENSSSEESFTTDYVVWFNFALVSEILQIMNPSEVTSQEDVWTYVSSNENLRPLYLTYNDISIMDTKWDSSIVLKGDFTERQANYFVNKINNSNSFRYSQINAMLITNNQNAIMIYVLLLLFILFIIISIFLFCYYFGLLGLIASIVYAFTNIVVSLIYSSIGVMVTGLGIMTLILISLFTAYLIYLFVKKYKENELEKNISKSKVLNIKFKKINNILLVPLISLILMLYFASLLVNTLISVPIDLILISIVLVYLICTIILLPSIYLLDIFTNFSNETYSQKWEVKIGLNKELFTSKNNINTEVKNIKQKTLSSILIGVILLFLSLIFGAFSVSMTSTSINSNLYGTRNYAYNVQLVSGEMNMLPNQEPEFGGIDYYYAEEEYELVLENEDKIIDIFEDNNIKVNQISIVREDDFSIDQNNEINFTSKFGFIIYSRDAISSSIASNINENLSEVTINIQDGLIKYDTSFELTNDLSLSTENASKIISLNEKNSFNKLMISLLIIVLIVTIISLFIGNWGIALSTLITSLLEIVFIVSPLVILFIPFGTLVLLPIILFLAISSAIKISIINHVKNDEIENDKWIRNSKKHILIVPIMAMMMFVIGLFLIGAYSFVMIIPFLIVILIAPFVIFVIQQFTFTYLSKMFGEFRDRVKKNKLNDDIRKSKENNDNQSREEYIEGVNM
ncbi:MAG: hypothetical protein TYPL_2380 [Candidatus Tyloplasma litorale]|nr:MAG: hypothetical protein TYPL_2380 [Mycoplasmatales bacterium]